MSCSGVGCGGTGPGLRSTPPMHRRDAMVVRVRGVDVTFSMEG